VRGTGELIRSAGLDLRGAVLVRAERNDDSSGLVPPFPADDRPPSPTDRPPAQPDRP
jgi:hypothetical protein